VFDWWEFAKSFAGPIATVLASASALAVTFWLGKTQVRIAQSQADTARAQRDIALDKLKNDLFQQRYAVYTTAKGIMERVIRTGTERPIDDLVLLDMRIKLDEGRFFFPAEQVRLFERIEQLTKQHEVARQTSMQRNDDDETRVREGDVMADAVAKLSEIHGRFPELMMEAMRFAQLTIGRSARDRG